MIIIYNFPNTAPAISISKHVYYFVSVAIAGKLTLSVYPSVTRTGNRKLYTHTLLSTDTLTIPNGTFVKGLPNMQLSKSFYLTRGIATGRWGAGSYL